MKLLENKSKRPQRYKDVCFATDSINLHSIEGELILFINSRVLILGSTDWTGHSSSKKDYCMMMRA